MGHSCYIHVPVPTQLSKMAMSTQLKLENINPMGVPTQLFNIAWSTIPKPEKQCPYWCARQIVQKCFDYQSKI